jgi:pimeloyl-ACP methyl ester carboxylesterase
MPFITSAQNNADPIKIYYEDLGQGKPVVFIHGWPLSGSMWEYQITELINQGMRCITYDRRGFGKSDRHSLNYDYDTLTGDLKSLLEELDLQEVTLVGFSMGGGEIARYFSSHGGNRVSKVVLVSAVVPYMLKTDTNPHGVPQETFDAMTAGMKKDRPGFFESFNKDFFGAGSASHPVSGAFLQNALTKVMDASPISTLECAKSFSSTDFRKDVPAINVPTLIIHGDKDKTVPIEATGNETAKLMPQAKYIVYEGAAHGLYYTEKDRLNKDLAAFIL